MSRADSIGALFLGGAKRVSMARHFKTAAAKMGAELRLFSYELTEHEPIACEATVVIGKRWSDPAIYDDLHHLCTEHNISIVVPFVDPAVAVAARLHDLYPQQIFAPTAGAALSEVMFDKTACDRLFRAKGLPVPAPLDEANPRFPLIAKPRQGSASKGIVLIDDDRQLQAVMPRRDQYLIQQRIDRRRELTVDCYASVIDGTILATVPRVRDVVNDGEVDRSTVIQSPEAVDLVRRTLQATGLRGSVTVQLIEDLDTGRIMLMEINPRLGGGAVAAIWAGADLPAMILAEARGLRPEPCTDWRDLLMTRYRDEVVFFKE